MPKQLKRKAPEQPKQLKRKKTEGGNKTTQGTYVRRRDQPNPSPYNRPLSFPHVELNLIHELAKGERTQRELAEKYGVSNQAVSVFNRKHKARILEARANIENEMSSLWIAEKKNRVAWYQKMLEQVTESIEVCVDMGDVAPYQLVKVQAKLLESVAAELGQLPARLAQTLATEKITYLIPGVDMEKLK